MNQESCHPLRVRRPEPKSLSSVDGLSWGHRRNRELDGCVCLFAAVMRYHSLNGLDNRNALSQRLEVEIKVWMDCSEGCEGGSVPCLPASGGLLAMIGVLGLQGHHPDLCSRVHTVSYLCPSLPFL